MAVRPIDTIELQRRMCALCNQDYSDEPCEPSDCVFIRAINEMPTLTPTNDMDLGFDVIDTKTGEYPDLEKIALTEEWAQGLVYCDMDGFAVREDGSLILLDECGNCVSCPPGRFEIRLQDGGAER